MGNNKDLFDPRLAAILIPPLLDVSYGGEPGFNQAIELAADTLANCKIIQEKKVISKFLEEIAQDTGKGCFGIKGIMQALEMGAVETLIVWERLETNRLVLRNPHDGNTQTIFVPPGAENNAALYQDKNSGVELDVVESGPLLEWIVDNYKNVGAKLQFVSDNSHEGNQFCKGFGGVGGLLRYSVECETLDEFEADAVDSDVDFM